MLGDKGGGLRAVMCRRRQGDTGDVFEGECVHIHTPLYVCMHVSVCVYMYVCVWTCGCILFVYVVYIC
jgi:hypothetical protein